MTYGNNQKGFMIRLLAIDIDGTLYNSQQEISLANRVALKKARLAGIQTVLITGRGRKDTESVLDALEEDLGYICSAGSLIRSGKNGQPLAMRTFHFMDELRLVIDLARRVDAGLLAETPEFNWWFGSPAADASLDPKTLEYANTHCIRTSQPEVDFDQPLLKVTIVADPPVLDEFASLMDARCPSLNHTYSGHRYRDITGRGVDKGSALALLAGSLGLSHRHVAAIGDQPIDIPMLRFAGVSAAMGNASDGVKSSAKLTAPSHDQDGVAWFVEYLLAM